MSSMEVTAAAFSGKGNWTKEQLKLAFHLYCQIPFGKLHNRNPEIVELAALINRTPSALAMKLVNFASIDPSITSTGRTGLTGASNMDREIWNEFHENWERLAIECTQMRQHLIRQHKSVKDDLVEIDNDFSVGDFTGETRRALVEQRIKQSFFRRAILSSYRGRCCISGLSEAHLLVASHIVPWSKDKASRLNPCNGLCLSAIHDKAFDNGLITISEDFRVVLSEYLCNRNDEFIRTVFLPIRNRSIELPEKFLPRMDFLKHHREQIFIGSEQYEK